MSETRKYRDQEIRKIFELATSGDDIGAPALSTGEGLTLSQLQEVGREVGLNADRVARAASVLDSHQEVVPRGTTLGMPTSVGRIVELPRAVTEREWELIVSELRETFHAKGHTTSHGSLREWSNGNLHAFVEPTETGHRLRMTTFKGNARELNLGGAFMLLFAVIFLAMLIGKGNAGVELFLPLLFGIMGGGALASNVLGLPRWADERERQMEYIATRAKALIGASTEDHDRETGD